MHLLRTTPGGFVDDAAGVMRIEQTPAPIVVLSSADTTLSLLASAVPRLEAGFPAVRLANQAFLRQPASVDFYVDDVLRHARVVIVDHLGGEAYWPYGIERIVALAKREKQQCDVAGDRDHRCIGASVARRDYTVEIGIATQERGTFANVSGEAVEQHDAPIGVKPKDSPLPDRHVVVSVGGTLLRGSE